MKSETIDMNDPRPEHEAGRILRFWHQVEFFIPFDLEQQVMEAPDAEWAVQSWSVAALRRGRHSLWAPQLPPGRELTGFDVYFGVFDKSLLADVTRQVLRASMTPGETVEQEERGALEGLTCMAKLRIGPVGEPGLDDVSVSTAPWALGRIQRAGQLDALDFDAFQDGIEDLKESLLEFRRTRALVWAPAEGADDPVMLPVPLTAEELLTLQAIFEDWTGFRPAAGRDGVAAIVIRVRSVEEKPKKRNASARAGAERNDGSRFAADDDDGDDEGGADEIEVEILNSFFAKDIERAITSLEHGTHSPALRDYLAPLPEERRIDLYTASGREAILAALAPRRLPPAHWPDEPAHAMSLMQQFAINSLFDRLESGGVFSVNGPPGTGKTTLLRDVFAELITRRARVLAGLARAGDAFVDVVPADFQDERRCAVARLRPELTGFEMVVASSNNAAVENLSRDLPKSRALGKTGKTPWRDAQGGARAGYLRTVAHNVAARTAKGDYAKLDADDAPWGLVACALGRKRNRTDFAFRLVADARRAEWPVKGFEPDLHQSIWTWREKYAGPGFAAARAAFAAADGAVAQRIASLDRYAAVCLRLRGRTRAAFCADAAERVAQAMQAREAAHAALARLDEERALCARQLDSLREELRLVERTRPAWWLRWLRRERERAFQAEQADNLRQQREWLGRRRDAEAALPDGRRQLQDATAGDARAQRALAEREQEWEALQREREALAGQFPQMACPDAAAALDAPDWQIQGLWHDETLNTLRSELFVAALGLHEAWLAEVLRNGRFVGNLMAITRLLGGKRLVQREHAQAIWQSLFMVVPVVSSTFASIATQFRDLGPDSLGWLFIDEAGQAVPQAAVGALWRARRAVVVGDPLQIEPVFTVPIKLIEALARNARLPSGRPVEPHLASVQNLADEANVLGARIQVDGADRWIGSPLRVHRRCVDPMFTIANQIAYRGKMIYFDQHDPALRQPPPDSLDAGPSAWVDIGGTAQDRQAVPEQIELVCRAIVELSLRTGELPALYVISPFRRIKEALARRLMNATVWPPGSQPAQRTLRDWCRARIGTVHTFQGKEESMVWMVLGCDAETRGAAVWAAGKPNLFNVALTRAKHRFFLIGDAGLWGGLPHFADASAALLPRISPDVFLRRVEAGTAGEAASPAGACIDG